MRWFHLWLVGTLTVLPLPAYAGGDWIDEFPPATLVALAAFEELKVTSERDKLDMTRDDDSIAINLAGTFVVLRQILFLKYNQEPSLSKEREDKLRRLVAEYEEAELTIGQGANSRHGYITRGPPTGMGCKDNDCYRRWFSQHLNASSGRAEYRQRVLKRLFPCGDRARELNDLRQRFATTIPFFASPAVTLGVEPPFVGLSSPGCATYGGDANRNGLCDDWEDPTRMRVLDGPYCSADLAVQGRAGKRALALTQKDSTSAEYGFVIVRKAGSTTLYYASPPVRTTLPRNAYGPPRFATTDYGVSFRAGTANSSTALKDYVLVGAVHTHPPDLDLPFRGGPGADALGFKSDHFSMADFNVAVFLMGAGPLDLKGGTLLERDFDKIYVITARNACIRAFKPLEGDSTFTKAELLFYEVPRSVDLYAKYFDREIGITCLQQ